jgi:hypothetical protein
MKPGLVWLLLIPVFNYVWWFVLVVNLSRSLAGEFHKRGIAVGKNPGRAIGLTVCILAALAAIFSVAAPDYVLLITVSPLSEVCEKCGRMTF